MIKNDRQLGKPFGLFQDTKANIEALAGLTGGETAYATDTGEDGVYDAVASQWVWGRAGGGDVAAETHAATSKTTPVDDDEIPLVDSAASWVLKKLTWANLKATLKTYFDTLYSALGHSHAPDASVVTYTPAVAADWNSSADPGNVDDALDQLAERTKDLADMHLYPFGSYATISPFSESPSYPFASTLPTYTTYPKKYSQAVYIGVTNDASNYWTLKLIDYGTSTIIASVTTRGLATNSGHLLTDTSMSLSSLTQATHRHIYLEATKTGTPSKLYAHAPAVEYGITN